MKTQKTVVLAFLAFCIMTVIYCIVPIKIVGCIWAAVGLIYLVLVIRYEKHDKSHGIRQ